MQTDGEPNGYGPWLSALVGMLSSSYHLSIRKIQALLQQLLGIGISTCAIAAIRDRLSVVLTTPGAEALVVVSSEAVVHLDETGAPTGNADSLNPSGRRGWLWVMATAGLTVFQQGPSRSWDASKALLGQGFGATASLREGFAYAEDCVYLVSGSLLGLQQPATGATPTLLGPPAP